MSAFSDLLLELRGLLPEDAVVYWGTRLNAANGTEGEWWTWFTHDACTMRGQTKADGRTGEEALRNLVEMVKAQK